jgi:hypothetical protein
MRVFYLYGPPGVGKLTVGTSLAALTGFRLFHNHLTVNLATAVFPRETEPWRELIRHVRGDVVRAAVGAGVDLVCTGVYLGTEEQTEAIRVMLEPVYGGGGRSTTCSSRAGARSIWRGCRIRRGARTRS